MTTLTIIQWVSTVVAITGSFLTAMPSDRRKFVGFACYLVSNCAMLWWGSCTGNWGIVTCNAFFTAGSIMGLWNHRWGKL